MATADPTPRLAGEDLTFWWADSPAQPTTMAMLLWDAGILGLLSFSCVVAGTLVMAARLGNHIMVPPQEQAHLEALGALLLISCSLLVYNRSLVDQPAIQMLLAFAVGYTGSQWMLVATRASATSGTSDSLRVPAGLRAIGS